MTLQPAGIMHVCDRSRRNGNGYQAVRLLACDECTWAGHEHNTGEHTELMCALWQAQPSALSEHYRQRAMS